MAEGLLMNLTKDRGMLEMAVAARVGSWLEISRRTAAAIRILLGVMGGLFMPGLPWLVDCLWSREGPRILIRGYKNVNMVR